MRKSDTKPPKDGEAARKRRAWRAVPAAQPHKTEREIARERLFAAGVLATNLGIPSEVTAASDEELERLGQLKAGARGSEELVNEDRGDD